MNDELTAVDIKKMKDEIDYRMTVLAPKLGDEMKQAREMGDLSENFEYHAARREVNRNLGRIRYLQRMIDTAIVIKPESRGGGAGLFDRVRLLCEDENEEMEIVIVTTLRQNASKGYISKESPLGRALLGHGEGERVFVSVTGGGYYVRIISITAGEDDESLDIAQY